MSIYPRQSVLAWYWNRLRCMSVGEVGHRAYQKVMSRLQKFGLATACGVPPADLSRIARNFVGRDSRVTRDSYIRAAAGILAGQQKVFNLDCQFGATLNWNRDPKTGTSAPLVFGKTLNYRDESVVGDIKYLWEPNRHLHLVTLAQAYHQSGEQCYLDGLRHQLKSWFDQCPYLRGPNWTSSLELAIRLINWSIVWQLIGGVGSPVFAGSDGAQFRERWLRSIYQHMHFIRGYFSRYSSANNHLIGELSGLYVGCVTWPFWPDTAKWQQVAKDGLEREALLQNAADGVNREQAISYQQFVLDFLLFAGLAGRENDDAFSQPYWQRIESMLEFIASVMDVNGNVPMIGDADDGYVVRLSQESRFCPYRSLLATGAALFHRSDFKVKASALDDKTRWLLGARAETEYQALRLDSSAHPMRRAFPEGGYYILGCDFETDREIRLIADSGPLGYLAIAAHGHADALAFTLTVGGHEILIDPGTYAYHTEAEWRRYFRGTAAHNTVRVDGKDQSLQAGNFMWLQHAKATCLKWETTADRDRLIGHHDGYTRLSDPVVHQREITLDKRTGKIEVNDLLQCESPHVIERCWHFGEKVEVSINPQDGMIDACVPGASLRMHPVDTAVTAALYRGSESPPWGWVSRRFDGKCESSSVVWTNAISGTICLRTVFDLTGSVRRRG